MSKGNGVFCLVWSPINWNFFLFENRKRGDSDAPTVMEEDLRICTVRPVNDSDRRFCFEVISPTKSHILQADSSDILQQWITALHKGIGAAINCGQLSKLDQLTPVGALPGASNFKKM